MKKIVPLICLLLILGSCSVNPFSKRKYTNTRVWYKDTYKVSENDEDKNPSESKKQKPPKQDKPETDKGFLAKSDSEKKRPQKEERKKKKPEHGERTKKESSDSKLSSETAKAKNNKEEKELEFHRGYGMMAMLFGTLTAFLGIGIITFAVGYLSLGVYYQDGNLKKSRAMYYSAFAVGLISFIILLIILI